MAKTGFTDAGKVPETVPSIKSRGLKNPRPADEEFADAGYPDMTKGNDAPGKSSAGKAPASGKKDPTK